MVSEVPKGRVRTPDSFLCVEGLLPLHSSITTVDPVSFGVGDVTEGLYVSWSFS